MRMVGRENDVSAEENQGLNEGELIKAFRASNIMTHYRLLGEVIRQAATIDFVTHLERGVEYREPSGMFPSYLRQIDRQLQNDFTGGVGIQDGDSQIHMATRGEFLTQSEAMTEIGEMIHVEHLSVGIGMAKGDLIALLEMGWMMKKIMRIISRKIKIILIA